MRDIQKETSRRPRNRNQYLYVRRIGPGCWGTCPTPTQGGEWLSHKIPGAALWTSSTCTAWRRCPRWILYPSEPFFFFKDQKWHIHRERGLDCIEDDREPPTWISARVPWLCLAVWGLALLWSRMTPMGVRTTLCYTCNDIVTSLHIPDSGSFLF